MNIDAMEHIDEMRNLLIGALTAGIMLENDKTIKERYIKELQEESAMLEKSRIEEELN